MAVLKTVYMLGLGAVLAIAGCASSSNGRHAPSAYPKGEVLALPYHRKGYTSPAALAAGVFHAVPSGNVACAWAGDSRQPYLWPEGFHVAFTPTAILLDDHNRLVAREGQMVYLGGGGAIDKSATACAAAGAWSFSVFSATTMASKSP